MRIERRNRAGLEDAHRELDVRQARREQSSANQAAERGRRADRIRLAEDRFGNMERRALVDIDRKRTTSAKLQRTAEAERAEHAAAIAGAHRAKRGAGGNRTARGTDRRAAERRYDDG